jgi:hypothetical protein
MPCPLGKSSSVVQNTNTNGNGNNANAIGLRDNSATKSRGSSFPERRHRRVQRYPRETVVLTIRTIRDKVGPIVFPGERNNQHQQQQQSRQRQRQRPQLTVDDVTNQSRTMEVYMATSRRIEDAMRMMNAVCGRNIPALSRWPLSVLGLDCWLLRFTRRRLTEAHR